MKTAVLLAPGPSLTPEVAQAAHADIVGCVGNAYELCGHADFIAATDWEWWVKHPDAIRRNCLKFTSAHYSVEVTALPGASRQWNSGVLALECAVRLGATHIELYGFDMHGTHFFGPYTNGLANTRPERRKIHQQQYRDWRDTHPGVTVVNLTPGSALEAFPYAG